MAASLQDILAKDDKPTFGSLIKLAMNAVYHIMDSTGYELVGPRFARIVSPRLAGELTQKEDFLVDVYLGRICCIPVVQGPGDRSLELDVELNVESGGKWCIRFGDVTSDQSRHDESDFVQRVKDSIERAFESDAP